MRKILLALFAMALLPLASHAEMEIGSTPKPVVLSNDLGGYIDGRPWDTKDLRGKVSILFYVDPDERDINDEATDALGDDQIMKDSKDAFATYVIINLDATWLPNAFIKSLIEDSQEEHPDTSYIYDTTEKLNKDWGIATDNYDIVVLDKEGKVAFSKDGVLSKSDIKAMLKAIHDNL